MRIAYFLTHPIQYQSPLIRHLRAGGVDVEVFYGTDAGRRAYFDPGFGKQIAWDVPLLDGYPHTILNDREPGGGHAAQVRHYAGQISPVLKAGRFDAVWVHGWWHPMTSAVWAEATQNRLPLLLRGETFLGCVHGGGLKRWLHRLVYSRRFRRVAACLPVGTLNHQFYRAYGVPEERLFRMPYAVDNAFFQARCREAAPQREKLRAALDIEPGRPVLLFCGKLIAVKDPATLIRAVGKLVAAPGKTRNNTDHVLANVAPGEGATAPPPVLLVVGDGELRPELEALADEVAPGLVKFLGFRNQTELSAFYDLCDLFVLPSIFEPWGLVVNEVMNAGKPVIVSDQVGAGADLVQAGVSGDVFRAGDVTDLTRKLRPWVSDAALRQSGVQASLALINQWSFDQCLQGMLSAVNFLTHSSR